MPKEPEVSERIRILAMKEVEQPEVGAVLASLSKIGFDDVRFELVTDIVTFNKRQSVPGGEKVAREWISQRQSFKLSDLGRYFKETGRGQSSVNYIVGKMVESGELISLGGGYYQQAPKALPPPTPTAAAAAEPPHGNAGRTTKHFEKTGYEAIWQHVKNRKKKPFSLAEVRELYRAQGRNDNSASPVITQMLAQKLIKRVDDGKYVAVEGAQPEKSKRGGVARNFQAHYDVSNRDLILAHVKGRKTFTSIEINRLFKEHERPVNSATGQLSAMVKQGVFKKGDDIGQYEVIKKSPVNGTGAATEQAHGS